VSHVKDLPSNPQASRPASKSGSRTGSSKTTIKSTLVDSVVISTAGRDHSHSPTFGLFQDEDETVGVERDAAASSPIKGRGRLTSSVNSFYFIFAYRTDILIYNRKLLWLRIPQNPRYHLCGWLVTGDNCLSLLDATKITYSGKNSSRHISNGLMSKTIHGRWTI
jgi:hypothetical protein